MTADVLTAESFVWTVENPCVNVVYVLTKTVLDVITMRIVSDITDPIFVQEYTSQN